jgi:beta-lactam-binding protein with PASTA domain
VKLVTVPDLFSASEAKASSLLGDKDLKVGDVTRAEANARPGTVFKQDPPAGAKVKPGTAVSFVLALPIKVPNPPDRGGGGGGSTPPVKLVTVPDLFSASEARASSLLNNEDLKVGEVTRVEANARPGTVFKQDPPRAPRSNRVPPSASFSRCRSTCPFPLTGEGAAVTLRRP